MNQQITVNGKTFKTGSRNNIAGKTYEVYNVMPNLDGGLVGFCRLSKAGKRLADNMSLSTAQIATLIEIGTLS